MTTNSQVTIPGASLWRIDSFEEHILGEEQRAYRQNLRYLTWKNTARGKYPKRVGWTDTARIPGRVWYERCVCGVFPLSFRLLANLKYLDLFQTSVISWELFLIFFRRFGLAREVQCRFHWDYSGTIPNTVGFLTSLGKRLKPNCKTQDVLFAVEFDMDAADLSGL